MDLVSSLQSYPTMINPPPAATFQDFILQQPVSIRKFLAHVELFHDPFTIMRYLQNAQVNYLVTDGASLPLRTAYGWILALDDNTILAEGNGPAAGNTTSYRAEAYGLHAGLRFLFLLCQFTQQTFDALDVFCDKKSIIGKANARLQYSTPFPTSTTSAKWDQIENAHMLVTQMRLDITYVHIKGHQDDLDTDLSLEAQLNVQADFLAGNYIYNQITPQTCVPVDEVCQCHLQIGNKTITSHYRQAIRDAASAPALRQYLLSFCTPRANLAIIDWNIFSTANQRLSHLRIWSTKFIYNLLPTVTYDKIYTYNRPRCITCPSQTDT